MEASIRNVYRKYERYVDDLHRALAVERAPSAPSDCDLPEPLRAKLNMTQFEQWWRGLCDSGLEERWLRRFEMGYAEDMRQARELVTTLTTHS